MPDEQELTAKPRSWRQFSIRALLLVMTGTALILGPWMHGLRRQRLAIARISASNNAKFTTEKRGLSRFLPDLVCNLFPDDFFHSVTEVRLSYQTIDRRMVTPDDHQWTTLTASLDEFPHLESLSLHTLGLESDDLAKLTPLGDRVRSLSINELFHGDLKSQALRHLEGWEKLETLSLLSGPIDGRGIESLKKIPNLSSLTIGSGTFESASLVELGKARSLERITFWQCRFDVNCLGSLKPLPNLKSVSLINMDPVMIPRPYQLDSESKRREIGPIRFRYERSSEQGAPTPGVWMDGNQMEGNQMEGNQLPGSQPGPPSQPSATDEYERQLGELLPDVEILSMDQS